MKFKSKQFTFIFFIGLVLVFSLGFKFPKNLYLTQSVDSGEGRLHKEVATIFKKHCSVSDCHKGTYPRMNLNLEEDKFLKALLNFPSQEIPSLKFVDKENPEQSYLLMKIKGDKAIVGRRMPLDSPPLRENEIKIIEDWISSLIEAKSKQEGLLPQIEKTKQEAEFKKEQKEIRKPAFWGTRVINLPTSQTIGKGRFLFRVSHRYFPAIKSGYDSLYGLDGPAVILLSFGYGLSDNLDLSLARTKLDKEVELSLKWLMFEQGKILRLPFSAALYLGGSLVTQSQPDRKVFSADNMKFNLQIILSHQVSNTFSLALVPAYSSNTNHWDPSSEGTFGLGTGGRWMIFNDFSIIWEWIPVLTGYKDNSNGWGLGVEKKIGGHVFQVFVLNSTGLTSDQFIPGGDFRLKDWDLRIGFNIFRKF
ncbi:MAG: hypothetical protein GTN73_09825 [Candidatus Aminicenantes bacterium]|nr:hypothetical protein [Candidatus Aminicenantes bacterium]